MHPALGDGAVLLCVKFGVIALESGPAQQHTTVHGLT